MTDGAYDKACQLWGDGVAWEVDGRYIIGRWIPTSEITPDDKIVLASKTKSVEVLGEGKSWEMAFSGKAKDHPDALPTLCISCEQPLGEMGWCDNCDERPDDA